MKAALHTATKGHRIPQCNPTHARDLLPKGGKALRGDVCTVSARGSEQAIGEYGGSRLVVDGQGAAELVNIVIALALCGRPTFVGYDVHEWRVGKPARAQTDAMN